jgi:hypothetical protein
MLGRGDLESFLSAALLLLGCATTGAGLSVLREWSAVGSTLAVLGLLWTSSGVAMVVSAVWLILSLGRQRLPLAIGGGGGILSGVLVLAGFLTHVIPCTGPA